MKRKAIYQYVFALAHGADKETFYYGDWIASYRRPAKGSQARRSYLLVQ